MSILSAPYFHNEPAAYEMVESLLWPNGPVCPRCQGQARITSVKGGRIGLYRCGPCKRQFTVKVGTVFESSHVPLNEWLQAVYLMVSSKKGISSHQLMRTLGCQYKTAWFMTMRVREAMKDPFHFGFMTKLGGADTVIEADETFKSAYGAFFVQYETKAINLDDAAHDNAQRLRLVLKAESPAFPWRKGLARGTVVGTLETVLNANRERQIVICPFVGARQIRCSFTDDFKDQISGSLFKVVRITGLMHYSEAGPHPVLIDVHQIESVDSVDDAPRFIDAEGLFRNSIYPPRPATVL